MMDTKAKVPVLLTIVLAVFSHVLPFTLIVIGIFAVLLHCMGI